MNPDELEAWIENVLDHVQSMIEAGDILPDELYGQIADAISDAQQEIDNLRNAQIPNIEITPSPGAELLWILSGPNPDAFVNYLRSYPDPEVNALLNNPLALEQTIQELSRRMPPGVPFAEPEKDGIPHADLNSSNIYGFQYDPKTQKLLVRFQGGSIYSYEGVPQNVFRIFQSGAVPAKTSGQNEYGRWWEGKIPSLGAAFYQMIRNGGYPYQRLS